MSAITNWILQLFPAEPKLGPVLTHLTNFQPAMFPMFLMVPAVFMDWLMMNSKQNDWIKSVFLTLIFVLLLIAIQYPLSGFLLQSPLARNWFFGADSWYFGKPPDLPYRYKFSASDLQPFPIFIKGIAVCIAEGIIICRISLQWGNWFLKIQR